MSIAHGPCLEKSVCVHKMSGPWLEVCMVTGELSLCASSLSQYREPFEGSLVGIAVSTDSDHKAVRYRSLHWLARPRFDVAVRPPVAIWSPWCGLCQAFAATQSWWQKCGAFVGACHRHPDLHLLKSDQTVKATSRKFPRVTLSRDMKISRHSRTLPNTSHPSSTAPFASNTAHTPSFHDQAATSFV